MDNAAHDYCLSVLQTYAEIPSSEWEKVAATIKTLHVDENDFYIREGDVSKRIAFIISGIFRVFCITPEGHERNLSFRTKGQFLAPLTPFIENKNCWYSIQAIEPCELIYSNFYSLKMLSKKHHACWEKLLQQYVIQLYIEKESREKSFLMEDANGRYLRFLNQYPELEKRIHNFHIASYLGISPVTLSRIRKEMKNSTS